MKRAPARARELDRGRTQLVQAVLRRQAIEIVVCDMLGAILLVQLKNGFSRYELEFMILGSSFALTLMGAGRFSLDSLIADRGDRRVSLEPAA